MQMYVNFFDRFQRAEHDAKTIGIVLCSEKNDAMVKITLPEDDEHVLAARYQMYLPTEKELRANSPASAGRRRAWSDWRQRHERPTTLKSRRDPVP